MKKLYWLFVSVILLFFACSKDDDQNIVPTQNPNPTPTPTNDTAAPQITITSPVQSDTYLAIGVISISAEVTDDVALDEVNLFLVNPSGQRRPLTITSGNQASSKRQTINEVLVPGGTISGNFSILIEAKDHAGKSASKATGINIIAEPLSTVDFKTDFMATGWFERMGCCPTSWNEAAFNTAFYYILNRNPWDYGTNTISVDEFGKDFGGHSNLWAKWDTNDNDYLEESELAEGMDDLGFFEAWDKNNDNLVSEEEIADGIAILWDVNKDNVVSAAEFESKLIKYFLS